MTDNEYTCSTITLHTRKNSGYITFTKTSK